MTCPSNNTVDRDKSVTLPGGASITLQYPGIPPNQLATIQQMMAQAGAGLAPMQPLFDVLGAVLSLVEFAQAVPDLITNPTAVAEAVVNVVEKAAKLANLVPQLSVPASVVSMLDIVIDLLDGILSELEDLARQSARIQAARDKLEQIGQNPDIEEAIACGDVLLEQRIDDLNSVLSNLGGFVAVLDIFLGLIGIDGIGEIASISNDLDDAVDTIDGVLTVVKGVRQAIPL